MRCLLTLLFITSFFFSPSVATAISMGRMRSLDYSIRNWPAPQVRLDMDEQSLFKVAGMFEQLDWRYKPSFTKSSTVKNNLLRAKQNITKIKRAFSKATSTRA